MRAAQLREKREELNRSIAADEEEKGARAAARSRRAVASRTLGAHDADAASPCARAQLARRRRPCARLLLTTRAAGGRRAPAAKIQNDLRILTERLARINDNLARKVSSRTEYDKTITEVSAAHPRARRRAARCHPLIPPTRARARREQTEAAYSKIMESSQTLLHVLKRESVNLTKKKQSSE